MENKKINEETLNKIYRNAHIALQSISNVRDAAEDEAMKNELNAEYDGYEKIVGEISSAMAQLKLEPKDINMLKKGMLWSSVKLKTAMDNSRRHLADMMIQGTIMGIIELYGLLKDDGALMSEETRALTEKLLEYEEACEKSLKQLL
ncbi:MAG: hypothetical protein DBX59_10925 [Bacillota bacterium]|nr:MAG: hypothetical protein DBX59_10925 [Bacillota bacterium]